MKNIEILHEDDEYIVINKPAGLAVQGGAGVKTSLDKLLAEIRSPPPLLVHRLDKDTSGVLLAAKNREAAAKFSKLLKKAVKIYTAVCAGCLDEKQGTITEDLLIRGQRKKSQTKYKTIKTGTLPGFCDYSVIELELATGRMHQIRRHLAMKGTPILGDDKYGNFQLNKNLKKTVTLKRLLLHASRLTINELNLDITAPPPNYFTLYIN